MTFGDLTRPNCSVKEYLENQVEAIPPEAPAEVAYDVTVRDDDQENAGKTFHSFR